MWRKRDGRGGDKEGRGCGEKGMRRGEEVR